jgi:hypothetical protein
MPQPAIQGIQYLFIDETLRVGPCNLLLSSGKCGLLKDPLSLAIGLMESSRFWYGAFAGHRTSEKSAPLRSVLLRS